MKKIISFLSIIVVLSSCEKEVNVNIPKKDPRLVINGLLAKDSVIKVSIGKSRSVLDPVSPISGQFEQYVVKNATALLFENNLFLDTLLYDASQYRYISKQQKIVKAGNTYTIKASAPGFASAEASSAMPSQSVISMVSRTKNVRTDSEGNPEDEVILKLDDPTETNFYLVQIFMASYGYTGGAPVYCVSTTDKDIEPIGENADPFSTNSCFDGNSLLMKDVNFNGGQKQVRFYIDSYQLQDITGPGGQVYKPYIVVQRITDAYFKFIKSYNVYYNSYDNPFAEPSNVYTNVKNGYGIFTTFTEAKASL